MGKRGPAPKPTALRILGGETRPSRINHAEPKPSGMPRMPVDMPVDAKKVWRRIVRDYGPTGVLTAADADVLRAYCEAFVRYTKSAALLEETGPLVSGARQGELVKNPLHQVVRDNATLMRALGHDIGLSPAARTGLHAAPAAVEDPVETFLGGRRVG